MNKTITTRHISKNLITRNDSTESTFLGTEVENCSISPNGVVKATVDEKRGVVTFTKYDSEWTGEIDFNLVTSEGSDKKYINNYKVEFNESNTEEKYTELDTGDDDEEIEMLPEEDEEVEILSDDEEDETEGGSDSFFILPTKTVVCRMNHYSMTLKPLKGTGLNYVKWFGPGKGFKNYLKTSKVNKDSITIRRLPNISPSSKSTTSVKYEIGWTNFKGAEQKVIYYIYLNY